MTADLGPWPRGVALCHRRSVPTISNPTLTVQGVAGHPGQRRVCVAYDMVCDPNDPAVGRTVVEQVVIHAVGEHGTETQPQRMPILDSEETLIAAAGTNRRAVEHVVNRVDLDVQQDSWSTDHGGGIIPMAEWVDHIAADIRLEVAGDVAAEVTTPTVTGSWGALGHD